MHDKLQAFVHARASLHKHLRPLNIITRQLPSIAISRARGNVSHIHLIMGATTDSLFRYRYRYSVTPHHIVRAALVLQGNVIHIRVFVDHVR
jgi:hypothetical protein